MPTRAVRVQELVSAAHWIRSCTARTSAVGYITEASFALSICQTGFGSVHSLRQPEKTDAILSSRDLRREPRIVCIGESDLTPRSRHTRNQGSNQPVLVR